MLYYWKISYNKFWRPPRPPQLTTGCHLCSKNATAQLGTGTNQGGPGRTGGHSRPWRPGVVRELPDLPMLWKIISRLHLFYIEETCDLHQHKTKKWRIRTTKRSNDDVSSSIIMKKCSRTMSKKTRSKRRWIISIIFISWISEFVKQSKKIFHIIARLKNNDFFRSFLTNFATLWNWFFKIK
jgi:hypothetical protein